MPSLHRDLNDQLSEMRSNIAELKAWNDGFLAMLEFARESLKQGKG